MTEPEQTDHRAEAERWLWEFHDTINHVTPSLNDMLKLAHIHALLAINGQLSRLRPQRSGSFQIGMMTGDTELDEALPTISRDDVPTGTLLYAPGPRDLLAYVNGRWWRQV